MLLKVDDTALGIATRVTSIAPSLTKLKMNDYMKMHKTRALRQNACSTTKRMFYDKTKQTRFIIRPFKDADLVKSKLLSHDSHSLLPAGI
jgi:hypothetical protein